MHPQQVWHAKRNVLVHIACTSLKESSREYFYFDSGFSKHMIGVTNYLKDIKPFSNSYVMFGDVSKGKSFGKRNLDYSIIPLLNNVLVVDGLTAKLISISQVCDQDLCAKFDNMECIVTNK